jgi:hypothetical protein
MYAKNIFRVTQTNLWHLFLENMTSLVVQVVGKKGEGVVTTTVETQQQG